MTRRVGTIAITILALGLFAPLPAAQASCGEPLDPLTVAQPIVANPTEPGVGPDTLADPCLAATGTPDPKDLEVIEACKRIANTYVRTWLVAQHLGPSTYGINYLWTGSGYVSIPKTCATQATAHTRLINAAASQIDPIARGNTKTETEHASAAYSVNPEALATVMTGEFWTGPPPGARGPAVVTVQTWGSFIFRPTDPAASPGPRVAIECMERKFQVQADPAASYGTVIDEISYAPCTPT